MSPNTDKQFKMKMRDMENAFKYRRIPYPKRSVELIALLAISCTFFLFMHTNKLNSRLKEMEVKLQPSEFSALGLTGNHISGRDSGKQDDINTLHGTYQYLKSTGQRRPRNVRSREHRHYHQQELNEPNTIEEEHERPRPHHRHHHDHHNHVPAHHDHQPVHHDHHSAHHNDRRRNHLQESDEDTQVVSESNPDDEKVAPSEDEEEDDKEISFYDDDARGNGLEPSLLNNTPTAEVDFVFFNRVPKVGSQSLMELMARLGKLNGFVHARDKAKGHETVVMGPLMQKALVEDLLTREKPHIYSQHIAYINFTRFHMPKPIYINLVRDPIERLISWHYYVRARWYYIDMKKKLGDLAPAMPSDEFLDMDMDTCVRTNDKHCDFPQMEINNQVGDHRRQTLFFCGHNRKLCMPFNSPAAMQKAKRTVEQDYAVVGTWEDTNVTLTVLEHYIPRYFKHAKVTYYLGQDRLSRVNRNGVKKPVSDVTREILRKNLTNEIEFYEFCKQRLYLQYAAINHGNKFDDDDYVMVPDKRVDYDDNDY